MLIDPRHLDAPLQVGDLVRRDGDKVEALPQALLEPHLVNAVLRGDIHHLPGVGAEDPLAIASVAAQVLHKVAQLSGLPVQDNVLARRKLAEDVLHRSRVRSPLKVDVRDLAPDLQRAGPHHALGRHLLRPRLGPPRRLLRPQLLGPPPHVVLRYPLLLPRPLVRAQEVRRERLAVLVPLRGLLHVWKHGEWLGLRHVRREEVVGGRKVRVGLLLEHQFQLLLLDDVFHIVVPVPQLHVGLLLQRRLRCALPLLLQRLRPQRLLQPVLAELLALQGDALGHLQRDVVVYRRS
mmetsp:Transcript_26096/g.73043  ORF Transcript_26096/g.73043 Transcript_26096/m.73043 type:complete len:292 (-) Transcript_26096:1209-2084(-)